MKILLDTSPLQTGHAIRGVGAYTRNLSKELEKYSLAHPDFQLVHSVMDRPDIIHFPFFDFFAKTLPIYLNQDTKLVVTVHDVIPLLFPEHYPVGIKGSIYFWRQKLALKRVDAVITDSTTSKNDIVNFLNIPAEKVHVVYLAGNPEIQKTSDALVKQTSSFYKLPDRYVLYVGDINYNKNIPNLLKAIKQIPDCHLVCVGSQFYPHDISEWHAVEQEMQSIQDRVHLIADLEANATEVLSALYTGAALYIQPSLYEGFGLPILEAMQCSTPVVCANNSSLIEVGGKHVEFVETDDVSLMKGINRVLALTSVQKSKRVTAAFEWSQTFQWSTAAKNTVAVYQELL